MIKTHCDCCGEETFMQPINSVVKDENGFPKKRIIKKWVQELNKYIETEAVEIQYEQPRFMPIQLHMPDEWIKKDFCPKCWKEKIAPLSDSLKNLLLSFGDK